MPFYEWSTQNGYRDDLTIDRIDNDKGYSPENCRWTTQRENCRNTRRTRNIKAFGEEKCLIAWGEDERCAASTNAIMVRLNKGWDPEKAITTPCKPERFECKHGHPLTGDNLYLKRDGYKDCRACIKQRKKRYRDKMKALKS